MKKIISFFKECYGELKKVNWPSREDVISQTIVVVVSLLIVSGALAIIDFVFMQIVSRIVTLGTY
jgi:preprotein translocase subunit SecE